MTRHFGSPGNFSPVLRRRMARARAWQVLRRQTLARVGRGLLWVGGRINARGMMMVFAAEGQRIPRPSSPAVASAVPEGRESPALDVSSQTRPAFASRGSASAGVPAVAAEDAKAGSSFLRLVKGAREIA